MKLLRSVGMLVLWMLAGVGVLSGLTWGATAAGLIQPLVVVSGSMSPEIRTGDLVVSRSVPITAVSVGDVITLTNRQTQRLVTHRVIAVTPQDGRYAVVMKGDANDAPDAETYLIDAEQSVPTPILVVPAAGRFVEAVSRPGVAIPLLFALAALVGLAALPPRADDSVADDTPDTTASEPAEASWR